MNSKIILNYIKAFAAEGFTLIELLIVFAVIGVLGTVAVIVINPSEITKEARDSKRFEELNHINIAISEAVSLSPNINLGVASSVYVSIPDSSATCANLGLSTSSLPTGWSYRCSTSANFKKVDGSGWIPVNFSSVEGGSVFASLPVDPVNTTSSGLYYNYVPGNSFQLTALFESLKYVEKSVKDGGVDPAEYETGGTPALAPFSRGKVGYWKFDETSGATSADSSGFGNYGTINTGTSSINRVSGKVSGAINFDGADDYVGLTNLPVNTATGADNTVVFWMNWTSGSESDMPFAFTSGYDLEFTTNLFGFNTGCNDIRGVNYSGMGNVWVHVAAIFHNNDVMQSRLYINGVQQSLTQALNPPCSNTATASAYIAKYIIFGYEFGGKIDDVRIYNRALSASEIRIIYNATK